MIDCLVAGDSIAVGVAYYLPCKQNAKNGISSAAIVSRVYPGYRFVIISSGSNDCPVYGRGRQYACTPGTERNLERARQRAGDAHVIWIEPVHPTAREAVQRVAKAHGDATVSFVPSPHDGLHPSNNAVLANRIKEKMQ